MSLRTSLARFTRRDPDTPSLRDRLAATKAKAADIKHRATKAAKVARIVYQPLAPEPKPVDRVALVTYATWLHMERRLVCAELYPQAGPRAEGLIASAPAAHDFHFPPGGRWQDVPQPSTRAVRILDMVGVDWRSPVAREATFDPREWAPATTPHGWPEIDAALLEALDDLQRLDAAQSAMHRGDDREGDKVPGYDALEEARGDTLDRLAETRAESLIGLQAKARAILTPSVADISGGADAIAEGLARDLLGMVQSAIEPRPDPIHAAIKEGRRLLRSSAFDLPDVGRDPHPDRNAAQTATWDHFREVIAETVPTTARGCAAIARYVAEFRTFQGVDLDDEMAIVLANIARSPLL